MCFSLSLSLSLSLLQQRAKIHRLRSTERERERSLSKATVVQGMSAKHPLPHAPLQVSSSRPNFILASFLYKLITTEGTSRYYRCVCGGGGRGGGEGCWVWWNIFIRGSPMLLCPHPPPTTHAHTSRRGNIF